MACNRATSTQWAAVSSCVICDNCSTPCQNFIIQWSKVENGASFAITGQSTDLELKVLLHLFEYHASSPGKQYVSEHQKWFASEGLEVDPGLSLGLHTQVYPSTRSEIVEAQGSTTLAALRE